VIRVLFLVNGDSMSAAAMRARAFASAFDAGFDVHVEYRTGSRIASIGRFLVALARRRPDVAYVMDMAYSGVLAAGAWRLACRNRMIVDTGDAIAELARSVGERGRLGLWLTDRLERFGSRVADAIVVRGTKHVELLGDVRKPVVVVQDGVDTASFLPVEDGELRDQLAPEGAFTVGLVGSSVWSERLGICYGWELVEVIHLLRDKPAIGIMIGGGSGIEHLRTRCAELGIEDRVRFVGHIASDELPRYLGALDVCLSTQTNDIPGSVRTTGKLPLYLAAGGVILASCVGEAALVLDGGQLVDYDGVVDREYPRRLAGRIGELMNEEEARASTVAANRMLVRERFEYRELAGRVVDLVATIAGRGARHRTR
jgi:glycosyltransferase involved in cell wall biosynthesis